MNNKINIKKNSTSIKQINYESHWFSKTRSQTIPVIATTDEALSASAALVAAAAAAAAEIGLIVGCHKHCVRLGFIKNK